MPGHAGAAAGRPARRRRRPHRRAPSSASALGAVASSWPPRAVSQAWLGAGRRQRPAHGRPRCGPPRGRGDHPRPGAGRRRRCGSSVPGCRRSRASPGGWPPRTPPAAPSARPPRRPRSSSAWPWSASSPCSPLRQGDHGRGGRPRVHRRLRRAERGRVRRPSSASRPRSPTAVAASRGSTWSPPSASCRAEFTYPDGDVSDVPGLRSTPPRPSTPCSTRDGRGVRGRPHRRRHRRRRRAWPRTTSVDIGDTDHDHRAGGEASVDLEVAGDQRRREACSASSRSPGDAYQALMPRAARHSVFGTVDDGADVDAVLADVDEAIADVPSARGARPGWLHRRHRRARSPGSSR